MMQVNNPFQMNDWNINKFLHVILAIQLAMWGSIVLDTIGLQIPILRQIIGFFYLSFIPGIIILRILKLHKLGDIETLLYSVGLSIALLMFTGFLMNMVYPLLGISGPISTMPLIITISAVVLILCILCYVRDKNFSDPSFINLKDVLSLPALSLYLLPFLAIFGTYLVNSYQNNILLMFMIVVIAAMVILIGFDKFIPPKFYPLAVFLIAISLLYHRSLISMHLVGWDIQNEYYLSNIVLGNSIWNSISHFNVNLMLSIVMLAPIYSIICDMSLIWVFKIIYPFLFSLTPLGLYMVFQKQTNDKTAFAACFFFMSFYTFFTEMLQLARQEIAELFFVLFILLLLNKRMNTLKRTVLLIIFGYSIIVSHYGLAYFFIFYLIFTKLSFFLIGSNAVRNLWRKLVMWFDKDDSPDNDMLNNSIKALPSTSTLSILVIVLIIIFGFGWFQFVGSGTPFDSVTRLSNNICQSIESFLLKSTPITSSPVTSSPVTSSPVTSSPVTSSLVTSSPVTSHSSTIIQSKSNILPGRERSILMAIGLALPVTLSIERLIFLILQLCTQFFIIVGIMGTLFNPQKTKFHAEYIAITLGSIVILLMSITLPFFAAALNITRIYHITLFSLAPFGILGGIITFRKMFKLLPIKIIPAAKDSMYLKLVIILILVPYFLFNTGFIYEITGDVPTSISLNSDVDHPRFNKQEILSAKWLTNIKNNKPIYADDYRQLLLKGLEWDQVRIFPVDIEQTPKNSYIYFGSLNAEKDMVLIRQKKDVDVIRKYVDSKDMVYRRNQIYSNGGAAVYSREVF